MFSIRWKVVLLIVIASAEDRQTDELIYILLFSRAEFQEAFNLFDNRGDGKIQLNQANNYSNLCRVFIAYNVFAIFSFQFIRRLVNVFVPWVRIPPNRMLKSAHTNWNRTNVFRSKSSFPSTMRFQKHDRAIRPTISLKDFVISIKTPADSFPRPNWGICWQRWAKSWPTTRLSNCSWIKRTRRVTWTTRNSSDKLWTDK